MKSTLLALTLISLGTPMPAQTMKAVTPPGFDTKDAPRYANYLEAFSGARMQFTESNLTGNGAKSISQVGHRLDSRRLYSRSSGAGVVSVSDARIHPGG